MTETQTTAEQQTVDTEAPNVAMPAATLRDMLAGALTTVSTDATAPESIRSVKLAWDAEGVRVESTDKFRLTTGHVSEAATETVGTFTGLIAKADVDALVKSLPKATKRNRPATPVWLSISDTRDSVTGDNHLTVRTFEWTRNVQATDPDGGYSVFPRTDQLWPTQHAGVEGDTEVGIAPESLAKLAKLPTDPGTSPWRFRFNGPHKPIVATNRVDSVKWRCLMMPVKIVS